MTIRITCILVLLPIFSSAQSLFDILKQVNQEEEVTDNIATSHTTSYMSFTMSDTIKPDTTITFNGQETKLYKKVEATSTYLGPYEIHTTYIAEGFGEGNKSISKLNSRGNMIFHSLDLGDTPGAEYANNTTFNHYDSLGRLTSSVEEPDTTFSLSYRENGLLDYGKINLGIMGGSLTSAYQGDTIVYTLMADLDPELMAMMGGAKDLPHEIYYLTINELNQYEYSSYSKNPESDTLLLTGKYKCDKDWNSLEEISYYDDGDVLSHTRHTYDSEGRPSTYEDVLEGNLRSYEYDDHGNLLLDPSIGNCVHYTYDEFGNVLTETSCLSCGNEVTQFVVNRITYK